MDTVNLTFGLSDPSLSDEEREVFVWGLLKQLQEEGIAASVQRADNLSEDRQC
jgi:hypothetical protein